MPRLICHWPGNLHLGRSRMGEGVSWNLRVHVKFSYHWRGGVGSWLKLAPVCASHVVSLHSSHRAKHLFSWHGNLSDTQKVVQRPWNSVSLISFLIWAMRFCMNTQCSAKVRQFGLFYCGDLCCFFFIIFTVLFWPVWGGRSSLGNRWRYCETRSWISVSLENSIKKSFFILQWAQHKSSWWFEYPRNSKKSSIELTEMNWLLINWPLHMKF